MCVFGGGLCPTRKRASLDQVNQASRDNCRQDVSLQRYDWPSLFNIVMIHDYSKRLQLLMLFLVYLLRRLIYIRWRYDTDFNHGLSRSRPSLRRHTITDPCESPIPFLVPLSIRRRLVYRSPRASTGPLVWH